MAVYQEERAQKAWIKLVDLAKSHKFCSYKELRDFIGIPHHGPVRYSLDLIQKHCMINKLPPITILVINSSGKPGPEFIAAKENEYTEKQNEVFSFNWDEIENPFDLSREGYSQERLVNDIVNKNEIPEKVLQLVVTRGTDQLYFRKALIKAYSGECCICGLSVLELLEVAHIKPYHDCTINEKVSINNGLLLCSNHHKLYDNNILKISKEYKIIVTGIDEKNESNRKFICFYDSKLINLPSLLIQYPSLS